MRSSPLYVGGLALFAAAAVLLQGPAGDAGEQIPVRPSLMRDRPAPADRPDHRVARIDADATIQRGRREDVARQFPWLSDAELDDGRRFIDVDLSALAALQPSDAFGLMLTDEGLPAQALVEDTQDLHGVHRLLGSWWDAHGREGTFGLSLADDGSYVAGSFTDSKGATTQLEALQGRGWALDEAAGQKMLHAGEVAAGFADTH